MTKRWERRHKWEILRNKLSEYFNRLDTDDVAWFAIGAVGGLVWLRLFIHFFPK